VPNGASFDYEYYLKDHLDNTRVAFNEAGEVSQETHYYPFGLRLKGGAWQQSGASRNKYLYNGKELEGEDLGLNWFDYGARCYDPQLGIWHSVDPVDEFWSPFAYVGNNPIIYIDPTGMLSLVPILLINQRMSTLTHDFWMLDQLNQIQQAFDQIKAQGKNTDNFISNVGTAARMTLEWAFWFDPKDRTFENDRVANSFRNSRISEEARVYWYKKVNQGIKTKFSPLTNFRGTQRFGGGNFGPTGLHKAGIDPIEQFVGSTHDYQIRSNGTTLTHIITNKTSFKSLMYGMTPKFLNFYVTGQTFIFTEPIDFSRIKNK